jgi:hypothetical protein
MIAEIDTLSVVASRRSSSPTASGEGFDVELRVQAEQIAKISGTHSE